MYSSMKTSFGELHCDKNSKPYFDLIFLQKKIIKKYKIQKNKWLIDWFAKTPKQKTKNIHTPKVDISSHATFPFADIPCRNFVSSSLTRSIFEINFFLSKIFHYRCTYEKQIYSCIWITAIVQLDAKYSSQERFPSDIRHFGIETNFLMSKQTILSRNLSCQLHEFLYATSYSHTFRN